MAIKKKEKAVTSGAAAQGSDDFSAELIKQLNKEHSSNIAFNLGTGSAPTEIKRWISTGSRQLDSIISNKMYGGFAEGRVVEIQGAPSCHAKNTNILMYDGTLKKSQHIKVGDRLMGPDSKARTVLEVHTGTDEMYEVAQKRGGRIMTFNQHHELALKNVKSDKMVFLKTKEFSKQTPWFKRNHKWVRVDVKSFGNESGDLKIPAYILGLLLGDGSLQEKRIELTTMDLEIKTEFKNFVESRNFELAEHPKKNNLASGWYYKTGIKSNQFLNESLNEGDSIRKDIRELGLLNTKSGNKFVPFAYKTAHYQQRLELLAGLIDTDGHLNKNMNYDFVSKSKQLADDVAFIARSVGLVVGEGQKIVDSTRYYRLCIAGDISKIPCRLDRKVPKPSKQSRIKNPLETGISVKSVGQGEFFGWTVDSDNLYLSEDFSVLKNSGKSHIAYECAKATQKLGGIAVYIDTENATSLENLQKVGIDTSKRFVFVQSGMTEEVFAVAESTILKARQMTKDVPITIIWDSVAASAPKAELEGDYEQNTIGLQARVIGKGLRKITNLIGNQNVLFLLVNQQRQKIGVMFGDPCVSPETKIKVRRRV